MKFLKLIILFVIIVGAIILAFNWDSLFGSSKSTDDFGTTDIIDIPEKCDEIRDAWENAASWDESLYRSLRDDINQSKGMGLFTEEGYNTVNNTLRENAANKACDSYLLELKKTDASYSLLDKHYSGVQFIMKEGKMDKDPRIINIQELHSLYCKIRQFSQSSHLIKPDFDAENGRWDSFVSLQNRIIDTASSYKSNSRYKDLKHISGFADALDESKLKNQIGTQRTEFYQNLSKQIIRYFQGEVANNDNKAKLDLIYNHFVSEDAIGKGATDLASFRLEYK
jgi:hypothetical protein